MEDGASQRLNRPACPVCGKPQADPNGPERRLIPFCSARCADVDLGRWFTGHYRVAAAEEEVDPPDALG